MRLNNINIDTIKTYVNPLRIDNIINKNIEEMVKHYIRDKKKYSDMDEDDYRKYIKDGIDNILCDLEPDINYITTIILNDEDPEDIIRDNGLSLEPLFDYYSGYPHKAIVDYAKAMIKQRLEIVIREYAREVANKIREELQND